MSSVERVDDWDSCDMCGEHPHIVDRYTGAMGLHLVVATCATCGWIHGPYEDPDWDFVDKETA